MSGSRRHLTEGQHVGLGPLAGTGVSSRTIDAHKPEYDGYYEACLRLVRPGGLIAFDNMLQGGDVADRSERGPGVTAIRALNAKIAKDARVDAVLLPVGDGMTLARRVR